MHIVTQKALAAIQHDKLLRPSDTVLVALSGGADSVTLLRVMLELQETLSLKAVGALHLHHGLRGAAADRDEQFVRELCTALDVPLTVAHTDVKREAEAAKETCEQAGRRLRYAFFAQHSGEGVKIATAHTQNDQAETVLLHLIRGSGVHGLGGIAPQRGDIIRPLLTCTRAEIEDYCRVNGQLYCHDESNEDERFSRNRVRCTVLPQLETLNPAVQSALYRLSQTVREEDDYWRGEVECLLANARTDDAFSVAVLQAAHPALRRRALLEAAHRAGATNTEHIHVLAMERALAGGAVELPQKIRFFSDGRRCHLLAATVSKKSTLQPLLLEKPFNFGADTYIAHALSYEKFEKLQIVHKNLFSSCFGCDKIESALLVRARCEGDSYHPCGRGCGKTLKKLFQEAHIPPMLRDSVPLVCDGQGIVLAVGFGADERARPTPDKTVIWIEKQP